MYLSLCYIFYFLIKRALAWWIVNSVRALFLYLLLVGFFSDRVVHNKNTVLAPRIIIQQFSRLLFLVREER